MDYVKIDFDEALYVVEFSSESMATLGFLLTDDVGYGEGFRRLEWILDDRYNLGCSNRTFMKKYPKDDTIMVGDLFTDDPHEAALSAPRQAMIDLLTEWDIVCATNPNAVIIYYENEKFNIEIKKSSLARGNRCMIKKDI